MRDYPMTEKATERFWSKVDQSGDCWVWHGTMRGDGYGSFQLGRGVGMKPAHAIAYVLGHGPIPDGHYVLHRCPGEHNPLCVNPAHLTAGTPKDNMDDRERQGNTPRGSKHGNAKLREHDIPVIRVMLAEGLSQWEVARAFGVKQSIISDIKLGKSWTHVPEHKLEEGGR